MKDIVGVKIVDINPLGVTVKDKNGNIYIGFEECVKNFARENSIKTSKCVATRDITKRKFVFYTSPKTAITFKKNFKDLFFVKSPVRKFNDLQKAINQYGYTSYDLS